MPAKLTPPSRHHAGRTIGSASSSGGAPPPFGHQTISQKPVEVGDAIQSQSLGHDRSSPGTPRPARWSVPANLSPIKVEAEGEVGSDAKFFLRLPPLPPRPLDFVGGLMPPLSQRELHEARNKYLVANLKDAGKVGKNAENSVRADKLRDAICAEATVDVQQIFPEWPEDNRPGKVTLSLGHVKKIVEEMNWSHERVCAMLDFLMQQKPVDVDASVLVRESLFIALFNSNNHEALEHMMLTLKADPLTERAMRAAMNRQNQKIRPPRQDQEPKGPWLPYFLARLDDESGKADNRFAESQYLFVQQVAASQSTAMPSVVRIYMGKANDFKRLNLTQPVQWLEQTSTWLGPIGSLKKQSGPAHVFSNGRTFLYIDTEDGQFEIDVNCLGDQGILEETVAEKGQSAQSLAQIGPLYKARWTEPFSTYQPFNRYRSMAGQKRSMTVIELNGRYEKELLEWIEYTPSNPWEDMLIPGFDGTTLDASK